MRCKGCDYPLWDIAARACPECGLPFRPSDYEFAINSVRFCCPHCHQSYYGTGQKGLLVPSRFHCVSCARLVDLDEMVVLPREGVPESVSIPDRMPWLERHRIKKLDRRLGSNKQRGLIGGEHDRAVELGRGGQANTHRLGGSLISP